MDILGPKLIYYYAQRVMDDLTEIKLWTKMHLYSPHILNNCTLQAIMRARWWDDLYLRINKIGW